jgi:hypothetical protein
VTNLKLFDTRTVNDGGDIKSLAARATQSKTLLFKSSKPYLMPYSCLCLCLTHALLRHGCTWK